MPGVVMPGVLEHFSSVVARPEPSNGRGPAASARERDRALCVRARVDQAPARAPSHCRTERRHRPCRSAGADDRRGIAVRTVVVGRGASGTLPRARRWRCLSDCARRTTTTHLTADLFAARLLGRPTRVGDARHPRLSVRSRRNRSQERPFPSFAQRVTGGRGGAPPRTAVVDLPHVPPQAPARDPPTTAHRTRPPPTGSSNPNSMYKHRSL